MCILLGYVDNFSSDVGCRLDKLPFNCLGLPVGQNLTRMVGSKVIIDLYPKKLSKWKVYALSFGGRSMLLKPVLLFLGEEI